MSRKDLAENFSSHLDSKFSEFKWSLRDIMNAISPSNKESGHEDALVETLARNNLRMKSAGSIPALKLSELKNKRLWEQTLILEYVDACVFRDIGVDPAISTRENFAPGPIARGNVTEPFNPPTYSSQIRNNFEPSIRLDDIIMKRVNVSGSDYRPGIINNPQDTHLTDIGEGGDIPETTITTAQGNVTLSKTGYSLGVSDEIDMNPDATMDLVTRAARQRAGQMENELVHAGLQLIGGTGVTAYTGFDSTPTSGQIITLHETPRGNYAITSLIGTPEAVGLYASTDIFYSSNNRMSGAPSRQDTMRRLTRL